MKSYYVNRAHGATKKKKVEGRKGSRRQTVVNAFSNFWYQSSSMSLLRISREQAADTDTDTQTHRHTRVEEACLMIRKQAPDAHR